MTSLRTDIVPGDGKGRLWWDTAPGTYFPGGETRTPQTRWIQDQFGAYWAAATNAGRPRTQMREYRFAGISNYEFTEGTLKNFSVGGAVRWESKASIGFLAGPPETSGPYQGAVLFLDNNKPVWDKARFYVDLSAGYKFRFLSDKVRTKVQLNVKNALEGGRLQMIGVNPDGNGYADRIVEPRQFILSASIELRRMGGALAASPIFRPAQPDHPSGWATSMNRRDFLVSSTAAASLAALDSRVHAATAPGPTDDLLSEAIRANDEQIPGLLAKQERRTGHRWLGGQVNEYGLHTAQGTSGFISAVACAACAPGSKYFRSAELVEPLRLAIRYLLAAQHDDGTVDFYATNFHSPPDTAFIMEAVSPACVLLRASPSPELAALASELGRFIVRGGDGLVTGGVHTPNHRWVVSAALAWANSLFPNPRYVARIDQWLAETIDLDPDGQYTEKSTTVYSPIVNRALLTVARLLDRPALLEPVRRNLEMTLYYVHADGEVVTEASRRQDRYQRGSMGRYYYSYRTLALRDGNGRFAAMARLIEASTQRRVGELAAFLSEPEFGRPLPPGAPLPTDYAKVFSYSNLARIRRGPASGTILAANTTLFSFHKGAAALEAVRFASAFFGKGQFTADTLEVKDGRYVLRQELDGPYFQPLSPDQIATGEHTKMAPNGTLATNSKALRTRSNLKKLESVVEITEARGRFQLAISIVGTDDVPVSVELAFRSGGNLEGVEPVQGVKDAFLLRHGTGRYVLGNDTIEFGPGRADHTYTQIRGALPKSEGLSVYLTGLTPFRTTLTIA
ncbi:MAG: hypothetical protein NTV51_03360 [Verrucomicrobia bacterium]|nr:hypothetical protein [Verrucomicrobiota bacterium]